MRVTNIPIDDRIFVFYVLSNVKRACAGLDDKNNKLYKKRGIEWASFPFYPTLQRLLVSPFSFVFPTMSYRSTFSALWFSSPHLIPQNERIVTIPDEK